MTTTLAPRAAGESLLLQPVTSTYRRQLRRVKLVWALLVLNVLTFYAGAPHILPVPAAVGKFVTQAALVAALLLVLSVNRPVRVRPSIFIFLLAFLGAEALMTSIHAEFVFGAAFRSTRLLLFVAVLWLLTPWWSRRDHLLIKTHLITIWVVLGTVVLGFLAAPGLAMEQGRLAGVLWPIPPTQVAHYAAVAVGLATVLWLSGLLRREVVLASVAIGVPILLLTHTRTALVALVAGVLVAGLSLFTTRARARRVIAIGTVVVSVGSLALSSYVATWLARGQDTEEVADLTGRRVVWESVVAEPRSIFELAFGFGLSNKSFNGLPIDSNWLATYYDVGLVGLAISAGTVLFLLVAAAFKPRGPKRALALFLIAYCLVASFTETGLSDASPYLLELTLAASLLISSRRGYPSRGGSP